MFCSLFEQNVISSSYSITYRSEPGRHSAGASSPLKVGLGQSGARDQFARFFTNTFNRGRLQRAERPPSRDGSAEHTLPLPPEAGGEFGQAAVYNGEVEYDADADEWTVTDGRFDTGDALSLANQDIWVSNRGGDFSQGRGIPGENDTLQ